MKTTSKWFDVRTTKKGSVSFFWGDNQPCFLCGWIDKKFEHEEFPTGHAVQSSSHSANMTAVPVSIQWAWK